MAAILAARSMAVYVGNDSSLMSEWPAGQAAPSVDSSRTAPQQLLVTFQWLTKRNGVCQAVSGDGTDSFGVSFERLFRGGLNLCSSVISES